MRAIRYLGCAFVAMTLTVPAEAQVSPSVLARGFSARLEAIGGYSIGPASAPTWGAAAHLSFGPVAVAGWYAAGGPIGFNETGASFVSVGGGVGIALAPTPRIRVEALLTGGAHAYSEVGAVADNPTLYEHVVYVTGVSGTLPYAGVRGDAVWTAGGSVRFSIGVSAALEVDLSRIQATQRTYAGGWRTGGFTCLNGCAEPASTSTSYLLGSVTGSLLAALGVSFHP